MSIETERLAEQLAERIMSDEEITRFCDHQARKLSKTISWGPDEFEQNENTAPYDLYWSSYAAIQVMIVLKAVQKLTPYVD